MDYAAAVISAVWSDSHMTSALHKHMLSSTLNIYWNIMFPGKRFAVRSAVEQSTKESLKVRLLSSSLQIA